MYGLKTLAELDVKPGDVVRYDGGHKYTIMEGNMLKACGSEISCSINYSDSWNDAPWFTLVSRASDTPKTWGEMTPEEKGALLLAQYIGDIIESSHSGIEWGHKLVNNFSNNCYYRVRPEPKRETKTCWWGSWGFALGHNQPDLDTHRITFDLIDGEPDCESIKMERI